MPIPGFIASPTVVFYIIFILQKVILKRIFSDAEVAFDFVTGRKMDDTIVSSIVASVDVLLDKGMDVTMVFDPASPEDAVAHKQPTDSERREFVFFTSSRTQFFYFFCISHFDRTRLRALEKTKMYCQSGQFEEAATSARQSIKITPHLQQRIIVALKQKEHCTIIQCKKVT